MFQKLFFSFGIVLSLTFSLYSQQKLKTDSLLYELKKWNNVKGYQADTSLYNIYLNLGLQYKNSKPDSAIYFFQLSLQKAQTIKDAFKEAESLKELGACYYNKSDYSNALQEYQKALNILSHIKRNDLEVQKLYSVIIGNIGMVYNQRGESPKALEYYFKALKINEKIGNLKSQANNLTNIGNVYYYQKDDSSALVYYLKALKINEQIGNKYSQAVTLNNIANVYNDQKNFNKALDFYFKALKICEENNDLRGQASNLGNIGLVYKEQKDYDKALEFYMKALKICEEIPDKRSQAINLENIASLYLYQKKYKEAEEFLKKAVQIAEEAGIIYYLESIYFTLHELYYETQQWKEALEYYKKHVALKDSLFNERKRKDLYQKEMQYELEKKELILERNRQAMLLLQRENELKELSIKQQQVELIEKQMETENQQKTIALLNKEKQIKEVEAKQKEEQVKRQRIVIYSVIAGIILISILLGVAIFAYLQKQKANKIITEQKNIIEKKNKNITDSIVYAQRIQRALLADLSEWKKWFPDSFVLYFPRDIVAGDFYWFQETEDYVYVAVADCTGHGVPGAMVSVTCFNALNKVVIEEKIYTTNEILDRTKEIVTRQLHSVELGQLNDGMDICLVRFEKENLGNIQFSGANRSLFTIKDNQINEYKGDRQPVGFSYHSKPFHSTDLFIQKDTLIYMFTDGLVDQFGYETKKKLGIQKVKDFLLEISKKSMSEQEKLITDFFTQWKGDFHQMDDVTIVAIKI